MTSTTNEDRARFFMKYWFETPIDPVSYFEEDDPQCEEYSDRDICIFKIVNACKSYLDDVAFIFNTKGKDEALSRHKMEIFDDLDDNLSDSTLRTLLAVMTAKTSAN